MNAYERVMNTLQGRPADRTPVFAVLGAYGGRLTRTGLRELYRDADAYVAGQEAVQQAFGFDMALAPFDFSAVAEAFGGEAAFFDDQPPNMKRPAAQDAAETLALPLPDPLRTGRLPFVLEANTPIQSPPFVPYFTALLNRFPSACFRATRSPRIGGRPGSIFFSTAQRAPSIRGFAESSVSSITFSRDIASGF